jgi:hypothetical protein
MTAIPGSAILTGANHVRSLQMFDENELVKTITTGISPDGEFVQLEFVRGNGIKVPIHFRSAAASSLMLTVEHALGELFENNRDKFQYGHSHLTFPLGPKTATDFHGSIMDGEAILSFVLDSKIRFDVSVSTLTVRQMIEWLEEIQAEIDNPPDTQARE